LKPIDKKRLRKYGVGAAIVLIVALVTYVAFSAWKAAHPDLNGTVEKVGRHMILPSNESPVMAVVEDSTKLQSSLKKVAQTNDIILVYSKSEYVIVYRPSVDKIVSVQPILTGTQGNASLNVTVAVYNGSGSEDRLTSFITALYEHYPNVRLVLKDTAPRAFPTTLVYAPSSNSSVAEQVAQGLSIKKGITPEGMSDARADITFIVGEDYGK
jgi:hypothetical protein